MNIKIVMMSILTKIYEQKKQSTNITSQSAFSINNVSQSNKNVNIDTSIK